MLRLTGVIKNYAWGGREFLPRLLHRTANGQPWAELWFGDHEQGRAMVVADGVEMPINQWFTENPQAFSPAEQALFGNKLPFLLKILDVRLPLSIQLHPNKAQAAAGFAREEAAGIARSDPARNYQDANHKPEMMIALSEFWLLHGFAPREKILANLARHSSLLPVREWFAKESLHQAYSRVMTASQDDLTAWLLPILAQPAPEKTSDDPDYWLHYTVAAMGITSAQLDAGLLSFYLFNIVHLAAGEAIFQPACLPHAYLRGQNIEVMATSNNVLRAGLTPKHIDIKELLSLIAAESITPDVIFPEEESYHQSYPSPVEDFYLQTFFIPAGEILSWQARELNIVLLLTSRLEVSSTMSKQSLILEHGEAILLFANEHILCRAEKDCYLVFASANSALLPHDVN